MDEMITSEAAQPPTVAALPLANLVLSLEQAAELVKQLSSTSDPNHLQQIYSALHLAQRHLSSFLQSPPPSAPRENSITSATGAGEHNGGEPMQVGEDDDQEEENSATATIDKVEERMRDCFIKNKRPKRPLSPSSAALAEERRLADDGSVAGTTIGGGFDTFRTRLRALDLIDQFHA